MFDCTTDNYETLYASWLENPDTLLDFSGCQPHHHLLDLCGGTGAVTIAALERHTDRVYLADLNVRLPKKYLITHADKVCPLKMDVHSLKPEFFLQNPFLPPDQRPLPIEICICRQAINYLDLDRIAKTLSKIASKFCFNTFTKPRWRIKTYKYKGQRYYEMSGYFGRKVFHIQAGPGFDFTTFQWYKHEDFCKAFGPYFILGKYNETKNSAKYLWINSDI
jgi:hypothetical protein